MMSDLAWVDPDGTLHDKGRLVFMVGDTIIGECPFDPGSAPDMKWRRQGLAYFCPTCCAIWARVSLIESNGNQATYEVLTVACEQHYDQWNKPGSFLAVRGLIKFIPPTVALRELALRGEATTNVP